MTSSYNAGMQTYIGRLDSFLSNVKTVKKHSDKNLAIGITFTSLWIDTNI